MTGNPFTVGAVWRVDRSLDGTAIRRAGADEMAEIIGAGATADEAAGIVRLYDGRYVAWSVYYTGPECRTDLGDAEVSYASNLPCIFRTGISSRALTLCGLSQDG